MLFVLVVLMLAPDHLSGGDNNIAIILGRYTPDQGNVQCSTNKKMFISGCRDILSGIPINTEEETFGRIGDPNIDVPLPISTRSRKSLVEPKLAYEFLKTRIEDELCTMTILTANRHGEADITSWYKIWEAANAAYYACVSPGYRGTFRGLGTLSGCCVVRIADSDIR